MSRRRSARSAARSRLAPFARRLLTVLGIDELGAYRVLRVADVETPEPRPGQFAMLAAAERWGGGEDERPYLPRAFSIARRRIGESHFLLEDVGPGTRRLCELREGDGLWALGPLGKGLQAPPRPRHRAILVGGGVGIAPLAICRTRWRPRRPPCCSAFATARAPRAPRCCTARAWPPTTARSATTAC